MSPKCIDIKATVFDIQKDYSVFGQTFFVDSNVWYWVTSPQGYDAAAYYQNEYYPPFFEKACGSSKIFASIINLVEVANIIEANHLRIYNQLHSPPISKKDMRYDMPGERKDVVEEIQASWGCLKALAVVIDTEIDGDTDSKDALDLISAYPIDSYDSIISLTMKKHGIDCILSDDCDFATLPGISVYTANKNVIETARRNGKLAN